MQNKNTYITAIFVLAVIAFSCCSCTADDGFGGCEDCHPDIAKNFSTSLHYTGAGMYDEYEIGAAGHFDIDMDEYYEQWKCARCHAVSCTDCHPGTNMYESHLYEVTIDTCRPCHGKKQTSTYAGNFPMDKSVGGNPDVHYVAGLECDDCHPATDLHGTGVKYDTQLEATNVECEGCHKDVTESRSHTEHDDKLDCVACHTGWMLTCENCHLDTRKGMTTTAERFLLGIGVDGKVTTFLMMNATVGDKTHHGYGEWYAHTTSATGKECVFCHENPDVLGQGLDGQIIGEGGSLIPQETIDRVLNADLTEQEKVGFIAIWYARIFG